jgi:hypothetical protein
MSLFIFRKAKCGVFVVAREVVFRQYVHKVAQKQEKGNVGETGEM